MSKALGNIIKLDATKHLTDYMTVAQKADVFNGAGAVDMASAFTAAVAAAKRIILPPVPLKVLSALSLPVGIRLLGEGEKKTYIVGHTAAADVLRITGNGVGLAGLTVSRGVAQSAGYAAIRVVGSSVSDLNVEDVDVSGAAIAILVEGGVIHRFTRMEINDTTQYVARILGGNDTFLDQIVADNDVGAQPDAGLSIVNTEAVWVTDCDLIHCGNGMEVTPASSQVTWVFVQQSAFDSGDGSGVVISPSGGIVRGVFMEGCWTSSNAVHGVVTQETGTGQVDGVFLSGHKSLNNGLTGILTDDGCQNVHISDPVIAGNSQASPGTHAGIDFQAGCQNFSVRGGRSGAALNFTATQSYGVLVNTGASDNYTIDGVDVQGNATAGIVDGGSGTNKHIRGCLGFKTANSGTSNIPNGDQSVVVAHGLPFTPAAQDISITATSPMGSNPFYVDTSSITSTQFTVRTASNVGANSFFIWSVRSKGA